MNSGRNCNTLMRGVAITGGDQGWFKLPLFVWSLYATAIIQVLATPVLGITLLMLIAEKTLHIGIFDPKYGGDPVLFQHFFWFYSHPAVYIMILPAMGVISELISVYSQKRIFGYSSSRFPALRSLCWVSWSGDITCLPAASLWSSP